MYFRNYRNRGATLVELLISLTISFSILSALFSLYLTAKKNFSLQASLATLQENAQFAVQIMQADIAANGFIGCARLSAGFPITNHTAVTFSATTRLLTMRDSVTTSHMDTRTSALVAPMQDFVTLSVSGMHHYSVGEIMLIADCRSMDIFSIRSIRPLDKNSQILTAVTPLAKNYAINADVGRLVTNAYFIKKTRRFSSNHQPVYALYRRNIHSHTDEIAEHINALDVTATAQGVALHLLTADPPLTKDWYAYAPL